MKVMKMKIRALAILISLAMAFTMMPMLGAPVQADDSNQPAPPAICLANGAAPNIKGGQRDNIYFGHYPQSEAASVEGLTENVDFIKVGDKNYLIEPIKWRALDFSIDSQGNQLPELVLLSDQNLDCRTYYEVWRELTWENSTIRAWLNGTSTQTFDYKEDNFIKNAFLQDEQQAINVIMVKNKLTEDYKPNPYYESLDGGENTEDKIFLLSINDAQNDAYGFTNDHFGTETRKAKNTAYAIAKGISSTNNGNGHWWLRSPGIDGLPSLVTYDGVINYYGPSIDTGTIGVRPAFNLNLSSVLFTSAAVGGKSSGDAGAGSLKEVGANETKEWKLTVKDEAHEDFKVESVSTCDGKTLKIKYSDAKKGDGEYISAIITDRFSNIKYYGNLKQFVDGDITPDTAEVTIDGKMESTDTLYIINEQLNGDKKTDYSSALNKIFIPAAGHKYGEWTKFDAKQHQKVCEHVNSHVVKENHKWDAGKVTKKTTEEAEGVKTYTCTVCKATKKEAIPKLKPSGTPLAKATVKKKSITIGWNKIKGADGYDIFFARCNHSHKKIECKNVKTIKGNKTFKWTKSGLKKGTAYKFYVRAYITKNGKKTYVNKTPMFHAYTGNGTKKYTNAKSVTIKNVKKGKLSLKKGKTFKIKAKVNKINKKKKLMPKSHAPTLRYMTSNKKVATVNSSGKITAKGKGTCTIIVYAHNGVSKSIKVTVK